MDDSRLFHSRRSAIGIAFLCDYLPPMSATVSSFFASSHPLYAFLFFFPFLLSLSVPDLGSVVPTV